MEQSTKEAWKRLLDEARRELPDATVRTWLEPAVPIALDDGRLIVGAPDQFAVEWNESKHASVLARAAERVFGRPTAVVFRVQEDRQQRPQMDFFVAPREPATVDKSGVPTTPLNERYTFQTFVIGKSNELAAAAAHAVAEAPGKTYNPLFIYGATGLGKTHLMQAVAHAVLTKYPGTRVHYFGAEQFINEVIESIHARTMSEFRRRYRNDVDLFLVDDVHFLEGKEMTQEEFFHTFNALFEGHKQIVLTSDRPPKEIPGLEDRLISRFEWGLVADIGHPDLEHRIAILRKKAEQDHLELTIPDDVLRFIAEHIRSSVRELEGCIIKLLLFASLKNREVTIELAREALSDKIPGRRRRELRRAAHPQHRSRPGSRGAPLGRDSRRAALQGTDQNPDDPAAGRDVSRAQYAEHAAGGDRPGVRGARPLDRDPLGRQGGAADDAGPDIQGARRNGAPGVVRTVANIGQRAVWAGVGSARRCGESPGYQQSQQTDDMTAGGESRHRASGYAGRQHFPALYYYY